MTDSESNTGGSVVPVVGAIGLVVAAVLLVLLWPQPRTSLTKPASTASSARAVQLTQTKAATGYRVVAAPVCVKHGAVSIRDVQPHAPVGGIHIVDWAVSAASKTGPPDARANGTVGRAADVAGYSRRSVSASCDEPQYIAIAVDRSSDVAIAHGFDITSSSGTVRTDADVTLCAATCP